MSEDPIEHQLTGPGEIERRLKQGKTRIFIRIMVHGQQDKFEYRSTNRITLKRWQTDPNAVIAATNAAIAEVKHYLDYGPDIDGVDIT